MQKIVGGDGVSEIRRSPINPVRIQRSDIGEDVQLLLLTPVGSIQRISVAPTPALVSNSRIIARDVGKYEAMISFCLSTMFQ